jgi:hypothetical protein
MQPTSGQHVQNLGGDTPLEGSYMKVTAFRDIMK